MNRKLLFGLLLALNSSTAIESVCAAGGDEVETQSTSARRRDSVKSVVLQHGTVRVNFEDEVSIAGFLADTKERFSSVQEGAPSRFFEGHLIGAHSRSVAANSSSAEAQARVASYRDLSNLVRELHTSLLGVYSHITLKDARTDPITRDDLDGVKHRLTQEDSNLIRAAFGSERAKLREISQFSGYFSSAGAMFVSAGNLARFKEAGKTVEDHIKSSAGVFSQGVSNLREMLVYAADLLDLSDSVSSGLDQIVGSHKGDRGKADYNRARVQEMRKIKAAAPALQAVFNAHVASYEGDMKFLFKRVVLDPITHQKERRAKINATFDVPLTSPVLSPRARQADTSVEQLTDQLRRMWDVAYPAETSPSEKHSKK